MSNQNKGFFLLQQIKEQVVFSFILFLCVACGNNGAQNKLTDYGYAKEEADNTVVNAIEQAKPTIMVLPSDNLLKAYGALKTVSQNGANYLDRDYSKYLLANPDNKALISVNG